MKEKKYKSKYKKHHYIIIAFMLLVSAFMLYPVFWMLMTSFKNNKDILTNRTQFFPEEWSLGGYRTVFEKAPIIQWFCNSLLVTVIVTLAVLFTATLIAYILVRYEFKTKKALLGVMLATMMVPGQITMIPRYLMIQKMHLFNTLGALIVPALISTFAIFLARQFIADIPESLFDAAKIDGAGDVRIYWSVVLPNIRPALGSIGIFTAMGVWNDYLNPLLMLNKVENMTLPIGLIYFQDMRTTDLSATMAAASIIMVPMIIIFLIFQKQFIAGLTRTGMK